MKQNIGFENLNKIKYGWNVGNFLDAHDKLYCFKQYNPKSVSKVVNLWHNPILNLTCLNVLKEKGFNCLRLPVTWCNFMYEENGKLCVSKELLNYLKEIINYAIALDYYVILDVHHDDHSWLKVACDKKEFKEISIEFVNLWKIIANEFKDYDNHLIFEGMNEIIDRSNQQEDWIGNNKLCFKNLNKLYKLFINTVRNFSFENQNRTLMISTYGAQIHKIALKHFKLPKDNNLIVDLHFYPYKAKQEHFIKKFKYVHKLQRRKNVPIILGEIGIQSKHLDNFDILKNYLDYLNQYDFKYVFWDNGKSRRLIDRVTANLDYPDLFNYFENNNQNIL